MASEVLATADLKYHADTLRDFIEDDVLRIALRRAIGGTVYVQDDAGRQFQRVSLVAETLSDGSVVHNLILS